MGRLFIEVLPLALGAAVSPLVFALQLATLTGPRRLARGSAFAAGAAVPVITVSLLALLFGRAVKLPQVSTSAKGTMDLVLAAVLFLLGIRTLMRPPKAPKVKASDESATGLGRSFAAGFGAMSANVTTFALLIPAMKLISQSDTTVAVHAAVAVGVVLVVLIPALVPLLVVAVAPTSSGWILTAIGSALTKHHRSVQVIVCFVLGTYLLLHGLATL
jgi:threonine/homoserine/homoserine lactone efflux protein